MVFAGKVRTGDSGEMSRRKMTGDVVSGEELLSGRGQWRISGVLVKISSSKVVES